VKVMEILLTGATGFVGSHVLTALTEAGHTVTALVRGEESAAKAKAAGATPLIGAVADEPFAVNALRRADAAIHAASPGDATSAEVDAAMVRAVGQAFAGSGKPYLHTGGLWEWGPGTDITEDLPVNPPAIVGWRPAIEQQALATPGARVAIIVAAVVYGDGGGMPNLVAASPRDAAGRLITIGTGRQRWATVHAKDLAALYLRAIESPGASGYFIAASGDNPAVRELTEAAARAAGAPGAVPETDDDARGRLGQYFADALLLDQQAFGAKARSVLGWTPAGPSLLEELGHGSYTQPAN
jgi:nucleoside-diphosphate-sugar epimerase